MKKHGKTLLGGDGHDKKKHGSLHRVTLTRDDSPRKHLLGADEHDKKSHGKHLLGRDGLCGAIGGLVTGGGTFGLKSGGRSTGLTGLGVGGSGGEEEGGLRGGGEASGNEESEEGSVDLVVVESSKRDSTLFSIEEMVTASLARVDLISPSSVSSSSILGGSGSTVSVLRTSLRISICMRDSSVLLEGGAQGVAAGVFGE